MTADQPSMSREPDVVDRMSAAQGWAKYMRVMTPEQRERMASAEFPRVDEPSSTLTDFLLARIDADERDARVAMGHSDGVWASWNHRAHQPGLRDLACGGERLAELPTDIDEHVARWSPARVLAECEAKRRIVEYGQRAALESEDRFAIYGLAIADCLRALAMPYADHPDFREEWRA